jgi:hypothetical protein
LEGNIISVFRIFTRLYGIISQKRELIITDVRTSVLTICIVIPGWEEKQKVIRQAAAIESEEVQSIANHCNIPLVHIIGTRVKSNI